MFIYQLTLHKWNLFNILRNPVYCLKDRFFLTFTHNVSFYYRSCSRDRDFFAAETRRSRDSARSGKPPDSSRPRPRRNDPLPQLGLGKDDRERLAQVKTANFKLPEVGMGENHLKLFFRVLKLTSTVQW